MPKATSTETARVAMGSNHHQLKPALMRTLGCPKRLHVIFLLKSSSERRGVPSVRPVHLHAGTVLFDHAHVNAPRTRSAAKYLAGRCCAASRRQRVQIVRLFRRLGIG